MSILSYIETAIVFSLAKPCFDLTTECKITELDWGQFSLILFVEGKIIPKIPEDHRRISEDSEANSNSEDNANPFDDSRRWPEPFRRFPKMTRTLPKISEDDPLTDIASLSVGFQSCWCWRTWEPWSSFYWTFLSHRWAQPTRRPSESLVWSMMWIAFYCLLAWRDFLFWYVKAGLHATICRADFSFIGIARGWKSAQFIKICGAATDFYKSSRFSSAQQSGRQIVACKPALSVRWTRGWVYMGGCTWVRACVHASKYNERASEQASNSRLLTRELIDCFLFLSSLQNLRVKYYKEGDWISEIKLAKGCKFSLL